MWEEKERGKENVLTGGYFFAAVAESLLSID